MHWLVYTGLYLLANLFLLDLFSKTKFSFGLSYNAATISDASHVFHFLFQLIITHQMCITGYPSETIIIALDSSSLLLFPVYYYTKAFFISMPFDIQFSKTCLSFILIVTLNFNYKTSWLGQWVGYKLLEVSVICTQRLPTAAIPDVISHSVQHIVLDLVPLVIRDFSPRASFCFVRDLPSTHTRTTVASMYWGSFFPYLPFVSLELLEIISSLVIVMDLMKNMSTPESPSQDHAWLPPCSQK